jgi:hypothetical protein
MSDKIASTFELASWNVSYNSIAQELHNPNIQRGIVVNGYNAHLVKAAAQAISDLGGWNVQEITKEYNISPVNPKYTLGRSKIQVIVGYSLESK